MSAVLAAGPVDDTHPLLIHSPTQDDEKEGGTFSEDKLRNDCINDCDFSAMIVERIKAPPLLMSAAAFWFMAFTGVYVLEYVLIYDSHNEKYNFRYPSGWGYVASTFSDLSHRTSSVQASIFQSCGIMSAISLQTSWYTELLRNVFTHQQRVRCLRVRWTWFRLIVPTMGMLLITGVTTAPTVVWKDSPGYSLLTSVIVNTVGCWCVFFSYTLSELHCLGYCDWLTEKEELTKGLPRLSDVERKWRLRTVVGAVICCALFCTLQAMLMVIQHWCPGIGEGYGKNELVDAHCDQWVPVGAYVAINDSNMGMFMNESDLGAFKGRRVEITDRPEVINTASGMISWIKGASLTFEYVGMVMFCLNVFVIWYFCEERHFDTSNLCPDAEPVEPPANEDMAVLQGNFRPGEVEELRRSVRTD